VRILFDQGTPVPLRDFFAGDSVATAHERGWSTLSNGELLAKAEAEFDLLVTTDQHLRSQQNMAGRKLAVLVLPTTNWPRLRGAGDRIAASARALQAGEIKEFPLPSA
jgi:predicted nuclease of predicted toxin-antitoxin system